jgi:hypothetical protein
MYAFDPRRVAILLVGGDKTGDDRWYETYVPIADRLYDECLKEVGGGKGPGNDEERKFQGTTGEDDS